MDRIWWATTDQDQDVLAMYARHYSRRAYADGRDVWQCLGPGDKFALRTSACDAIFGWRRFLDDCIDQRTGERQQGVNCAFFRNEGRHLSSECIRQADAIADALWPDRRHYTIAGITPTSIRKRSAQGILASVFSWPDGNAPVEPKAVCSSLSESSELLNHSVSSKTRKKR